MGLYNLCEEIYLLEKGKTKKLLFKKVVQNLMRFGSTFFKGGF